MAWGSTCIMPLAVFVFTLMLINSPLANGANLMYGAKEVIASHKIRAEEECYIGPEGLRVQESLVKQDEFLDVLEDIVKNPLKLTVSTWADFKNAWKDLTNGLSQVNEIELGADILMEETLVWRSFTPRTVKITGGSTLKTLRLKTSAVTALLGLTDVAGVAAITLSGPMTVEVNTLRLVMDFGSYTSTIGIHVTNGARLVVGLNTVSGSIPDFKLYMGVPATTALTVDNFNYGLVASNRGIILPALDASEFPTAKAAVTGDSSVPRSRAGLLARDGGTILLPGVTVDYVSVGAEARGGLVDITNGFVLAGANTLNVADYGVKATRGGTVVAVRATIYGRKAAVLSTEQSFVSASGATLYASNNTNSAYSQAVGLWARGGSISALGGFKAWRNPAGPAFHTAVRVTEGGSVVVEGADIDTVTSSCLHAEDGSIEVAGALDCDWEPAVGDPNAEYAAIIARDGGSIWISGPTGTVVAATINLNSPVYAPAFVLTCVLALGGRVYFGAETTINCQATGASFDRFLGARDGGSVIADEPTTTAVRRCTSVLSYCARASAKGHVSAPKLQCTILSTAPVTATAAVRATEMAYIDVSNGKLTVGATGVGCVASSDGSTVLANSVNCAGTVGNTQAAIRADGASVVSAVFFSGHAAAVPATFDKLFATFVESKEGAYVDVTDAKFSGEAGIVTSSGGVTATRAAIRVDESCARIVGGYADLELLNCQVFRGRNTSVAISAINGGVGVLKNTDVYTIELTDGTTFSHIGSTCLGVHHNAVLNANTVRCFGKYRTGISASFGASFHGTTTATDVAFDTLPHGECLKLEGAHAELKLDPTCMTLTGVQAGCQTSQAPDGSFIQSTATCA